MKILIGAASFASSLSGIQRHAVNLARCILTRSEIAELHFVIAPWQKDLVRAAGLPEDGRLKIFLADMRRDSLSRNLWHYRRLPELAAQLEIDVLHLSYPVPLNAARIHCPTVLTLHDMYPYQVPANFGFPKSIFNRLILGQALSNADAIACVSEAARSQLKRYAPLEVWRKSVQICNCVEAESCVAMSSPIPGWNGEPFLLCIAQHRKNKNIPLLIRTFQRLLQKGQIARDCNLIVVGITGPETAGIRAAVREARLDQSIQFLQGLSDPELQWCYRNCEALIAPSITEGFGLPVAEALLAGCRVVCSDIPAHREIGDTYCKFVSLQGDAVEALASGITEALREPKRPPVVLPQFSAATLAKQYVALYRRIIATSQSERHARAVRPVGAPA